MTDKREVRRLFREWHNDLYGSVVDSHFRSRSAGFHAAWDLATQRERERFNCTLRRIESACGHPDPAEACRVILEIVGSGK